jgi:hypothetical protein
MAAKKRPAKRFVKRRTAVKPKVAKRKTAAKKRTAGKRELIDTGTNKLYVRRNAGGTSFKEVVDVGKSLSADRQRKAKRKARKGFGDLGDR